MRKAFAGMYGPACSPEAADRDLEVLMKMKYSPKGVLGQAKAMMTYDLTADKVATLTMPALILHGDADQTVKHQEGQKLAEVLPNNQFITYPGAGHNFVVAYTEQANRDVLAFLAEVDATDSATAGATS
jgi:pimeloyl-ACP methyl ester carboxylesterase